MDSKGLWPGPRTNCRSSFGLEEGKRLELTDSKRTNAFPLGFNGNPIGIANVLVDVTGKRDSRCVSWLDSKGFWPGPRTNLRSSFGPERGKRIESCVTFEERSEDNCPFLTEFDVNVKSVFGKGAASERGKVKD